MHNTTVPYVGFRKYIQTVTSQRSGDQQFSRVYERNCKIGSFVYDDL
jgi:hypothetical protein